MKNYIFEEFSEIEENIKKNAPQIIYKYRGDWDNTYHKELVTMQKLWFSAPRDLNDPYDIRVPLQFEINEIEDPLFLIKLKKQLKESNPSFTFTEKEINIICENKLDEIRKNPKEYFEKNYKYIRESEIFDRVGLFSCSNDELNETMWAHYGNNHKGFVVGFKTVDLCRDLMCSIGPVTYSDEVPNYSFLDANVLDDFDSFFLKSKKWEYENEFRFFTIGNDENIERCKKYSISSVSEFLLGSNFEDQLKKDFIQEVKKIFPNEIPIYEVKPQVSGFGLVKNLIK